MKRFRIARRAQVDLDEIWLRIARESNTEIADRFLDHIKVKFPMLAEMREAGRTCDDLEPELRCFPARAYLIYYRKAPGGGIRISRVIHGMRDQKTAWEN